MRSQFASEIFVLSSFDKAALISGIASLNKLPFENILSFDFRSIVNKHDCDPVSLSNHSIFLIKPLLRLYFTSARS